MYDEPGRESARNKKKTSACNWFLYLHPYALCFGSWLLFAHGYEFLVYFCQKTDKSLVVLLLFEISHNSQMSSTNVLSVVHFRGIHCITHCFNTAMASPPIKQVHRVPLHFNGTRAKDQEKKNLESVFLPDVYRILQNDLML